MTLMGKGCLPDSHPLNYGAPGMHGSKYANWALNKSDLIIAVGTRFDDRVTGKVSAFAPGAKVIHFDIDAAEVGKIREADIPVVGPLKLALSQLTRDVKALEAEKRADRTAWHAQLEEWRALYPYKYRRAEGVLKPQTVIERLRDLTARARRATSSGRPASASTRCGRCSTSSARSRARSSPRAASGRWATACPAAVGAKAARPDATVVCIDGDGCFQMTCQELATAALERLPIVVVIINNGWLGMVRQWQELFYAERYAETHLTKQVPDYAQLAEALGGAGFMVDNEDDLDATLEAALDCGRTAVVDARVDPDENCYPMVPAGAASVDIIELPDEDERAGEDHGMSQHTVSVELENKPGALARVSQMFARRGYNIQSLAVGPDRAARHLAADAPRRLLRALARADREADAQARQRPARRRAAARRVGRARARADHGRRAAPTSGPS